MDQLHIPQQPISRRLRHLLTVFNCVVYGVGDVGGPILVRLYYLHGGNLQWLTSFLETAGWPLLLLPLSLSYLYRRRFDAAAPLFHINSRLFFASAALGILTGLDDFLYAYGLDYLPVSTAIVISATHLAFTALFAFLIVRQRFTPFSINAIALLTVGAGVLALHAGGDRPAGVNSAGYWKGFFTTIGAAALYGLVLPLVELAYANAGGIVTYAAVIETQLVMGLFATAFSAAGMVFRGDFQAIGGEAEKYGLGVRNYYLVLASSAVLWQCFFVGVVGVIFCVNTLLAAVIGAALIPVVEVLGVVFLREKFGGEKGVALVLSLWGLASYSYGEYREARKNKFVERPPELPGDRGDLSTSAVV